MIIFNSIRYDLGLQFYKLIRKKLIRISSHIKIENIEVRIKNTNKGSYGLFLFSSDNNLID